MEAPKFDLKGTSITKTEEKDYDEYIGTAEDLIAAGLVKSEQFPPEGKWAVSYLDGVVMPRRCRMDETYLRVGQRIDVDSPWSVRIGLPRGELAKRRAEANEKNRIERAERAARWAAERNAEELKERAKEAERAKRALKQLPGSARDFIRQKIDAFREMSAGVSLKGLDEPRAFHGYRFSTETMESALLALDAVVEVLLQGEVIFEADRHAKIVSEHQAVIRAADPQFEKQLKALTRPNAAILEGDAQ
jgi:hypothetical protein